jgi:2-polyprenyl-3-methyl-5-hydroxy-6-metoxy-1,4-benzoquinol methylase/spore coat polysaccharide biosynthesis predicted glycosyltransferase SpsG
MTLTENMRGMGAGARLFLPEQAGDMSDFFQSMNFNPAWRITDEELENGNEKIEFIILDRFQTPDDELSRWKKIAPVIGIDEGGPSRDSFDFLIDILVPEKLGRPPANIVDPSLLKFPPRPLSPKKPANGKLRVLISFGQEDSKRLGITAARALCAKNSTDSMEITLLRGALAKKENEALPPNVRVLESIPSLAEHLSEYDLVITHYGITAYEALYAGTPVLLASPTAYHAKLAKAAGFHNISFKNFTTNSYLRYGHELTRTIEKLKEHCEKLAVKYGLDKEGTSLAALCGGFSPQVNRRCPVCAADVPARSISRFSERTYRRCPKCGVIYMDRTCPPPIEYEREYFFESYKRQYGKTYLDDFTNIKEAGKRRLKIIKSLSHRQDAKMALFDIGCAYGPFLAAADEEGFSPSGIDPAEDAVRYVQQELGLPAVHGFFPHSPLPAPHSPLYDVVTLWFVIEHFTDCASVLSAIRNILKPGGILAFSTPSFSGISGRSSLRRFLSASPSDHRTVWSPLMCKKALALTGFKVKKTVSIGHHPERFPLLGKLAKSKKSPMYWTLMAISRIFNLGDTFEVYAQIS